MITFDKESAIADNGDTTRMRRLFKKLEEGRDVTICFLGGSITQGSLSSKPTTCYAYKVYEWFKARFDKADIKYVNAGVGGTTSVFGAARVDRDVLSYGPDLVVVEFSVNDECNEYFMESYEGLIRKLLYSKSEPAVICLYNFYYENGKTAQRLHSRVARHYGIPAASMQGAIYQDILSGKIEDIALLSPDGLHPNDEGHDLVSRVVINLVQSIYEEHSESRYNSGTMSDDTAVGSESDDNKASDNQKSDDKAADNDTDNGVTKIHNAPSPLTANSFESARRLDNRDYEPVLQGFEIDTSPQSCVADCFKNGWLGKRKGDKIIFDLKGENECTGIAIQYAKTMKRPAPIVEVRVDDDRKYVIDSAFDETWGDLLDIRQLFVHEEKKPRKLEIEVIDDKNGKAVPFNLVSIIITMQ